MARRGGVPGFSAAALRSALKSTPLTDAALARAARAQPSAISRYASGLAVPQPGRFVALARALGVDPASLLDDGTDDQLARLRAVAGLTQAELCEQAQVDIKRYEAAEAARRRLTPDDIIRVAAALGIAPERVESAHQADTARATAAASGLG